MGISEILATLLLWTPYLGEGFGLNILISLSAMVLGTAVGWWLGAARASNLSIVRSGSRILTTGFRNVPSFLFMYYIAFMTPVEFEWNEELIPFPSWVKAVIALTIPVIGFVSDQVCRLLEQTHQNVPNVFVIFVIEWIQYFIIILMASSTASVIGVSEVVGRANTVLASVQAPDLIIWVYLYVGVWFLLSAQILSRLLKAARGLVKRH